LKSKTSLLALPEPEKTNSDKSLLYHRLAEVDEFIAGLWAIHLAVKDEGYVQVISLPWV
jgi:hypothetical protein